MILDRLAPGPMAGQPADDDDFWYWGVTWPRTMSAAGVRVTPESAMAMGAVFRCVQLIAQTMAALPLFVFERRIPGPGKDRDDDHPIAGLLRWEPNVWQTAFEWKEMMLGHLLLRGNAYNRIVPGARGFADQLVPLHPDRMKVEQLETGRVRYQYTRDDGRRETLTQDEVFHIRGLSSNGLTGVAVVTLASQTIGLGLAAEDFGARMFSQRAMMPGVLKYPTKLTPEAKKNIRDTWQKTQAGQVNAHKVAVLENGLEWQSIGMTSEQAQFLATREFQVREVARWFGVPLQKLHAMDTQPRANMEQANTEFAQDTIVPWASRIEQAIHRDLFLPQEKRTYFAKFMIQGLVRADFKSRNEGYALQVLWGIRSPNEIRDLEDENPRPGGDDFYFPLNMGRVGLDGTTTIPAEQGARTLMERLGPEPESPTITPEDSR